jgi:hypothetical protein
MVDLTVTGVDDLADDDLLVAEQPLVPARPPPW